MTEDEAKGKWCPFANGHGDSALRYVRKDDRRSEDVWNHTLCIGSACMAWRWSDNGSIAAVRARATEGDGFCGLAGALGK